MRLGSNLNKYILQYILKRKTIRLILSFKSKKRMLTILLNIFEKKYIFMNFFSFSEGFITEV